MVLILEALGSALSQQATHYLVRLSGDIGFAKFTCCLVKQVRFLLARRIARSASKS